MDQFREFADELQITVRDSDIGLLSITQSQFDSPKMNIDEIERKVVNKCGRSEMGMIDMGAGMLTAAQTGLLTQLKAGSNCTATIRQINQDGGPEYRCELDQDGQGKFDVVSAASTQRARAQN
ncbi:hypothetical protein CDD83_3775 [Cordyceps sp. RAO-2017]|nr:hypothetical protein CDD83_3775 [Cordyceps sp. RAO-2017]